MRAAAHHMIRNMTSALALITSREPLYHSIASNLRTAFMSALRLTTEVQYKWRITKSIFSAYIVDIPLSIYSILNFTDSKC